jgi:hypothetical protein
VKTVEKCLKCAPDTHPMGRIVALGGPRFLYTSTLTNVDVRRASRTGPGYHDPAWESGADYPAVFVRWTSRDNVAVCIRLMAEGRLNVNCLTTHVISLPDVDAGISAIINDPDRILGVLFQMQH